MLGPTNTGKTHLAIERMLGHKSGMMGLPLRLLAREVFDRVRKIKGPREVALITGEEKILPATARYFICTVEAMPLEREVDFLAIDEVQLAADRDRGHTFTDRILRARGHEETMFLGSETVRSLIAQLLPNVTFITRPRFSELGWTGQKKLTRLPRRTAIVAFSAERVYAIAELVRRQRGGAAVVMGALSPRTRNAQVALYQSGDVDFVVATDAIGMGLNMDIDHVAFAATRKFDGRQHRALKVSELAQIAGRAGRYMNDGSFGTTGEADVLEPETVRRIEAHEFEPEKVLQWRNHDLDFGSVGALIASLEQPPKKAGLVRAREGSDLEALYRLQKNPEVCDLASDRAAVKRLWDVAQLPDFRNTSPAEHVSLIARLYAFLSRAHGYIPGDWLETQLARVNRTDGDIDTLATRIAHVRTWTYVSNRSDWVENTSEWQERTRAIEDRLSDALHERLTQRFVDRRTSVLMKRLRQNEELMASVTQDGEVLVEGEFVGRLNGFVFVLDPRAQGPEGKTLRTATEKAVSLEIEARAARLAAANDPEFHLSDHARVLWQGMTVAELSASDDPLKPKVTLLAGEELSAASREAAQARLESWLDAHVREVLQPLIALKEAEDIEGLARGVAFRITEHLGSLPRDLVSEDIRALEQPARAQLRKYGVRFGAYSIYLPALLKPQPTRLRLILWALRRDEQAPFADLPTPPAGGLTSVVLDETAPEGFYQAIGFRVCGGRAVRIDMLERLADMIRPIISSGAYNGGFIVTPDMMSLVGCSGEDFAGLLKGLGYRVQLEKVKRPKQAEPAGESSEAAELAQASNEVAAAGDPSAAEPTAQTSEETETSAETSALAPSGVESTAAEASEAENSAAEPQVTDTAESDTLSESAEPATEASADATSADAEPAAADASATEESVADASAQGQTEIETDAEPSAESEASAETEPAADATADAKADDAGEAAELEVVEIEVWRPQRKRRPNEQPRGAKGARRGHRKPQGQQAAGEGQSGEAGGGAKGDAGDGQRRSNGKRAAAERMGDAARNRSGKSGAPKKGGAGPKQGKPPRQQRDKPVDPDSPFAALAVLKEKNLRK